MSSDRFAPEAADLDGLEAGDRVTLAAGVDVSRETFEKLKLYETLLRRWQDKINLVASSTLPVLWERHFADSAQVLDFAPAARRWADLGSGAGFPGMVTAIRLASAPEGRVHLIESDRKKCSFLREVARETGAPAEVHHGRIEDIIDSLPIEAISARALARLDVLAGMALHQVEKGAICIFLKGQDVGLELTEMAKYSSLTVTLRTSRTNPHGRVAIVQKL